MTELVSTITDLLTSLPPTSPPPSRTHHGRDITTTPAQHLPVVLHPTPALPTSPTPASTDICFFDLETTFPSKQCPAELIEYGCLLVHRTGWYETGVYGTLVRPLESRVSKRSIDCNGITADMLSAAPTFADIAPLVHGLMHNRVWCGHNVKSFDIPQLHRAFDQAGHPRPVCAGVIDTLHLVRAHFRDRAGGSNAMSALTHYFGLGEEKHRAVSDCQQTLQAIKNVALSLFMERELPDLFPTPVVQPRVYKRRESGEVKEDGAEEKALIDEPTVREEDTEKEPLLSSASKNKKAVPTTPPSTAGKRPRGRPRKMPAPVSAPSADLSSAMKKLDMRDDDEEAAVDGLERKEVSFTKADAVREHKADAEEDDIQELEEDGDEIETHDGYIPISTVETKEDDKGAEGVHRAAVKIATEGSASPLLSPKTATSPVAPPRPTVHPALVALLDTATAHPDSPFHFLYASSNPLHHSTVRAGVRVEWQHRPWTFWAVVPHVGKYAAEAAGGSEGIQLSFNTSKITEVRDRQNQTTVWPSSSDHS